MNIRLDHYIPNKLEFQKPTFRCKKLLEVPPPTPKKSDYCKMGFLKWNCLLIFVIQPIANNLTFEDQFLVDLSRFENQFLVDLSRFEDQFLVDLSRFEDQFLSDLSRFEDQFLADLSRSFLVLTHCEEKSVGFTVSDF